MAKKTTAEATVTPEPAAPKFVPAIEAVIERRLQNPFGEGSPAVRLKDPGWTVHVINTALRTGRYHDVAFNKGWDPVRPEDLDGSPQELGFEVLDGKVVRGERGQEVLMKMPTKAYQAIQQAKDAKNRALVTPRRLKADVIEQTAAAYSDQAAGYLDQNVTIKESRGPVPLEEPSA